MTKVIQSELWREDIHILSSWANYEVLGEYFRKNRLFWWDWLHCWGFTKVPIFLSLSPPHSPILRGFLRLLLPFLLPFSLLLLLFLFLLTSSPLTFPCQCSLLALLAWPFKVEFLKEDGCVLVGLCCLSILGTHQDFHTLVAFFQQLLQTHKRGQVRRRSMSVMGVRHPSYYQDSLSRYRDFLLCR